MMTRVGCAKTRNISTPPETRKDKTIHAAKHSYTRYREIIVRKNPFLGILSTRRRRDHRALAVRDYRELLKGCQKGGDGTRCLIKVHTLPLVTVSAVLATVARVVPFPIASIPVVLDVTITFTVCLLATLPPILYWVAYRSGLRERSRVSRRSRS